MTDHRHGEMSRTEALRIAQETAALLSKPDNERAYREHVLVTLARLEVKFDSLEEAFKEHVTDDNNRFGTVTQKINSSDGWINKGIGIVACVVFMVGFIMWIFDRVQP